MIFSLAKIGIIQVISLIGLCIEFAFAFRDDNELRTNNRKIFTRAAASLQRADFPFRIILDNLLPESAYRSRKQHSLSDTH